MSKKILTILCVVSACLLLNPLNVAADSPYRSFGVSVTGEEYASPDTYTATDVYTGIQLGCDAFDEPLDFTVDEQGNFYILDSGNQRIVILDSTMQRIGEIATLYNEAGEEDSLYKPSSVFVKNGHIYVADTGNERVVKIQMDGKILQVYTKPEEEMYTDEYFIPLKVLADDDGNVYAIVQNVYQGIVVFREDGGFIGFFGSPPVTVTLDLLMDRFWKNIMTDEQREGISKYVPIEYNNFTMDKDGYIYAIIANTENFAEQLRKLNTLGNNIYPYKENFGEQEQVYYQRATWTNTFVDVAEENGRTYLLDSKWNRIYVYDSIGNRLACFGTVGEQLGAFGRATAICVWAGNVYVLDQDAGSITRFSPTEYGSTILKASALYLEGDYEEALDPWYTVLSMDVHNELAYNGIGEALLQMEDYGQALESFRAAGNRERESVAFTYYRTERLREHIVWILAGVFLLVISLVVLTNRKVMASVKQWSAVRREKPCRYAWMSKVKETRILLGNVLVKPIVHFQEMKFKRYTNGYLALFVLVLWFLARVYFRQCYGFRFTDPNAGEFNALLQIVTTAGPFLLFCITNWLVCSIMDGEGKVKEIVTYVAIALIPYILSSFISTFLSGVLTLDESMFLTIVDGVGIGWSLLLLYQGIRILHDYSGTKTVFSILFTVFGIAILLAILVLLFALAQQVIAFVSAVYSEIVFRK